jgi:hypothetical protein
MVSSIKVLDGDFYGTGKLPLKSMGDICVDFDWKVETKLTPMKNELKQGYVDKDDGVGM